VRNALVGIGFLVLAASPARADVDLSGPWRLEVQPSFSLAFSCQVQVTQAGSALDVSGPACDFPVALSGTIDPGSGVFTASGASDPLACPTLSVSGTASAGGDAFNGTFVCSGGVFPVSGTFSGGLCGNGVMNAGEQCDDGDVQIYDCCSPTCTFDPSTYSCGTGNDCVTGHCNGAGTCLLTPLAGNTPCGTDGVECTTDVCDGAGTCTHPNKPAGSSCLGDANPCTDGACDGAGGCVLTDNTAPCDDFNACTAGDTCAGGVCVPGAPVPAGAECDADGNACTLEACNASGQCLATGGCSVCCDAGAGCEPAPGGCKDPTAPTASAELLHAGSPTDDQLRFLWKRGEQTAVGELGDPLAGTAYTLCVYDTPSGVPALAYRASAPAGGTCGTRACWHRVGARGFVYRDSARTPDGIELLKVKAGAQGRASAVVRGKGSHLRIPFLGDGSGGGLDLPVTVQLRSSDASCFEASFSSASRSGPYEFRAQGGD
jgi:cysteine-rich repeat protein